MGQKLDPNAPRGRNGLWEENYYRGVSNAEEHMQRALEQDLVGCPCLTCRHGRRAPERQEAPAPAPKQIEAHWSD